MTLSAAKNGELAGDWVILYDDWDNILDGDRLKFFVGEVYRQDREAVWGSYAFDGERIELEISGRLYITGKAVRDDEGKVIELSGIVHSGDLDDAVSLIRESTFHL